MKDIAWVTCKSYNKLISGESLIVNQLRNFGMSVDVVIWDDDNVNWDEYRLIIVRTIWDYHLKIDAYLGWLDILEQKSLNVRNSPVLLRWNYHKFYLNELESRGVPILQSEFCRKGELAEIYQAISRIDGDQVILKPAVSASAHGLLKIDKTGIAGQNDAIDRIVFDNDVIVQEFQSEICESGEWSFMFFNKEFSHAVLKIPKEGDFRVQSELGGSHELTKPEPHILKQVNNIIETIHEDILYCRVDGIILNDQFTLMELELIEPDLFLSTDEIRSNFIKAIKACLE